MVSVSLGLVSVFAYPLSVSDVSLLLAGQSPARPAQVAQAAEANGVRPGSHCTESPPHRRRAPPVRVSAPDTLPPGAADQNVRSERPAAGPAPGALLVLWGQGPRPPWPPGISGPQSGVFAAPVALAPLRSAPAAHSNFGGPRAQGGILTGWAGPRPGCGRDVRSGRPAAGCRFLKFLFWLSWAIRFFCSPEGAVVPSLSTPGPTFFFIQII